MFFFLALGISPIQIRKNSLASTKTPSVHFVQITRKQRPASRALVTTSAFGGAPPPAPPMFVYCSSLSLLPLQTTQERVGSSAMAKVKRQVSQQNIKLARENTCGTTQTIKTSSRSLLFHRECPLFLSQPDNNPITQVGVTWDEERRRNRCILQYIPREAQVPPAHTVKTNKDSKSTSQHKTQRRRTQRQL